MKLSNYKSLVFDCDGVILNSNKIKTEAFYKVGLRLSRNAAEKIVEYHVQNGGISRYKKFEWLLQTTLGRVDPAVLQELLLSYANEVRAQLLVCDVACGLSDLKIITSSASWSVVSGGDQEELRWIFKEKGISQYFEAGIFGSPDSKDLILTREISCSNISLPALYIGDSQYDHTASSRAGIDFVFLSEWSEFKTWEEYTSKKNIPFFKNLNDLRMRNL